MPVTLLQQIEASGFFSLIRDSANAYAVLLWLHLLALSVWGGAMLITDLNKFGFNFTASLRQPKRISFIVAALTGVLLFGAKAAEYSYNPWFWAKMTLLALLAANYLLFRRVTGQAKLRVAGALSLVLWIGAVGAARGPATVKDIMHSMVDTNADFLFESVQSVEDHLGSREIAPQTDQEWQEVRLRARILHDVADLLSAPDRRAARPRDRSRNPKIENEPVEVQKLLDADRADFRRRAQKLRDASSVVMRAIDAKDKNALLISLNTLDVACEVCHLHFWYPKDKRAVEEARKAGILE